MATWNPLLPAPLVSGYGVEPTDNVIRTEMESGSTRARRRSSARRDVLLVSWHFSDDQFTIFRTWFDLAEGADGGAGWFTTTLWYGDGGAQNVDARFAGGWKSSMVGNHQWLVTGSLEIRPVAISYLQQQCILLGIMEKDVVLLWSPTTQADVLVSKIGPDATFAATGAQYDEAGVSLGIVAALHSKGVWVGPGYSNLFAGSVAEQTKTLTAQKYTVWCDAGSVVCGSYGTATAAAPLTFTATAGDCTFTPSGVTRWMLTATIAPMPYVAPGVTVASAAGSTTNGLSWAMSAEMTAALSGACTVAALVTMGVSSADTLGNTAQRSIVTCTDAANGLVFYRGDSVEASSVRGSAYDGTTYAGSVSGVWSRNEQHLKVVQVNAAGTQFRVGDKRIDTDSAIQWGSWTTYDGSFNPLAALRAAYGNTVPLWLKAVMVSKTGGLTDAQIEERIYA